MLRLWLGENEDAKLKRLARSMKNDISSGREVVALIPDQFSFAFDKSLYSELGARDFNKVTVLSFKRMSAQLIEKYGSNGVLLEPSHRLIYIFLAIRKLKSEGSLRVLSRSLDKPNFVSDMSDVIDSMKRSGVTPEMLMDAQSHLSGSLGDKLHDISLLYSAYNDELIKNGRRDESSQVTEGARIASERSEFKGKAIYLDRFDSFSPDELLFIGAALKDAHSVNVSVYLPNDHKRSPVSPYNLTYATQNRLVDLAKSCNCPIEFIREEEGCCRAASIEAVKNNLFTRSSDDITHDSSVKIFSCDTVYAEADLVAASICHLVENGLKYNDVTVFTHDIRSYGRIIESAFAKYNVPVYFDDHDGASSMGLMIFALSALEAVSTNKPKTDCILKLVRSAFSPLDDGEMSLLEDYCLRWNVEGDMWLDDFTACEKGTDINAVNAVRRKVILPLAKLRESVKNSGASGACAAFAEYLKETDLAACAKRIIDSCEPTERLETARLFKQLWQALTDSLKAVSLCVGDEKLTPKVFCELMRLILSLTNISNPPQKLDCVTVADVSRSIILHPKAAFVLGVNDTKFPSDVKKTGIFSGRDMSVLESMGIAFEQTLSFKLDSERLDCHKALSAPTDLLVLTYSGADVKGTPMRPSPYITRICSLLNVRPEKASSLGVKFYACTPAAAYGLYAAGDGVSASERASLRAALTDVPEYREKISRLDSLNANLSHRLSPTVARELFAPFDINVTASRIDTYNKCNFEYFCRYGLGISEIQPMNMDPNIRGTVMHYVFEAVLSHFGSSYSEVTDDELMSIIDRLLAEYIQNEMNGDFGKSAKFKADYARLANACFDILKNIREEFKVSKFRPVRFEYTLHDADGGSILSIPITAGVSVHLRGVIDRVDEYTDPDGKRYLRILDYKTGEKKLRFDDVYNGLNLQMLLYMLALTEGNDPQFAGCTPAGIVYMRSGFLECDDTYDPLSTDVKDRLRSVTKQLVRDGLIVDNPEAIKAMDSDVSGNYIPVSVKKDGSYSSSSRIISETAFKALEGFAKDKVTEFGKSLLIGKIDALPLGHDKNDIACRYCDYRTVCDRPKYLMKTIASSDGEKLLDQIDPKEEDGNA